MDNLDIDWIKGKFTGKPHMNNGKIYGFHDNLHDNLQENLWFQWGFPVN
jgi:hypothetical protein